MLSVCLMRWGTWYDAGLIFFDSVFDFYMNNSINMGDEDGKDDKNDDKDDEEEKKEND